MIVTKVIKEECLAYNKIWNNLKKKAFFYQMIFLTTWPFFDFCKLKNKKPFVVKFKQKFLGLIVK